jgi:hypothetical protein
VIVMTTTLTETVQSRDLRAGRRLEYFTLGWNLPEAAVVVGAGVFAGSKLKIATGFMSSENSVAAEAVLLFSSQNADLSQAVRREP